MQTIFPSVFGNSKLKNSIANDILQKKQAHAYIIEGPKGSGKHLVAREIAKALNCSSNAQQFPCNECISCNKVNKNIHPDLLWINDTEHVNIGVEAIRSLKEDLFIPPNDGDFKIYVIEDAERLTVQAQNAFLLSLEEPPPFVIFLLMTVSAEKLLPTIRSRAPTVSLQIFSPKEICDYLFQPTLRQTFAKEKIQSVASMAGGTIGNALQLLENDKKYNETLSQHKTAIDLSLALLKPVSADTVLLLNSFPKKDRQTVLSTLQDTISVLRDYLVSKRGNIQDFIMFCSRDEIDPIVSKSSLSKIISATDATFKAYREIERNGSVSLILTSLLLSRK